MASSLLVNLKETKPSATRYTELPPTQTAAMLKISLINILHKCLS